MASKREAHGSFFNPTMKRNPDQKDHTIYANKCTHSLLFEFNCSLEKDNLTKISVGKFHSWLSNTTPIIVEFGLHNLITMTSVRSVIYEKTSRASLGHPY